MFVSAFDGASCAFLCLLSSPPILSGAPSLSTLVFVLARAGTLATPLRATSRKWSAAKPRNPRHVDGIEGGRTRVSDILLTKPVFYAFRERHSHCFMLIFASKHCLGHFWAAVPVFIESGY